MFFGDKFKVILIGEIY